jgi:hypothetical protein
VPKETNSDRSEPALDARLADQSGGKDHLGSYSVMEPGIGPRSGEAIEIIA